MHDVVVSHDVVFKEENLTSSSADISTQIEEKEEQSQEECSVEGTDPENTQRQLRDRDRLRKPDFYGVPVAWFAEAEPINFKEAIHSDKSEN